MNETPQTTPRRGIVEHIEFTLGGCGNQWTTIDGIRHATWWDALKIDWKVGDTVEFDYRLGALPFAGGDPVPIADNIRKVPPAVRFNFSRTVEQGEDEFGRAVFGFCVNGMFIHDPFSTLGGDLPAHPPEEHDITWEDADSLRALNKLLRESTDAAINAACAVFQDAVGIDGSFAGLYYSDESRERELSKGIATYILAELQQSTV